MNWVAVWLSMELAFTTALLLLVIGLPLAYWIAFSKWRWKFLIEALVALPIVLPPTVLGFYLLVFLGSHSTMGRLYASYFDKTLVFSFEGLVIASIFYSLPFTVQPLSMAFSGVNQKLIHVSSILNGSRMLTFFKVILPLSYKGVLTAFVMSFAHTIGEFGVVLMVGGNIPGETRTLSIDLYDQVLSLNESDASDTALFLLVLSFCFLSAIYSIDRKSRERTFISP
ncbi:MAG: molybdate ABC transporter permease subunit [Nitrospiria bacterium]